MKKPNRQIGYIKPELKKAGVMEKEVPKSEVALVNKEETLAAKIEAIENYEKKATISIIKWIKSHPEFKWGVMCKNLSIDKGNFHRTINSKEPVIKLEDIIRIEETLKKYGYAE